MIEDAGRRPPSVGVNYCSAMRELVERDGAVDLIEVEPQTIWLHAPGATAPYRVDEDALADLVALPVPKLLHGIGFPVGGTCIPDRMHFPVMREMIAALQPAWVSEHLAFNEVHTANEAFTTAFMLPPRQTRAGVDAATRSIRASADALQIPFAVETGVNYWPARADEMPDGAFVAEVIESADCGLVLDLHNLWTNERNGRQPMIEFVAQLPLERVWEIHLAGGEERKGFWLDGHNDAVPVEVIRFFQRVAPKCPNLRAVVFEVFSAYVPLLGLARIEAEVERVRATLAEPDDREPLPHAKPWSAPREDVITPQQWEAALGRVVVGRAPSSPLERELADAPGLAIVDELLDEFRGSMVAGAMPLTMRLLLRVLGDAATMQLLASFWRAHTPEKFAVTEARAFAEFVRTAAADVRFLDEVAGYEAAVLHTLCYREARTARFHHDPLPLLRALGRGELPDELSTGDYCVDLTP